jgi:hypothetical protein
MNLGFKSLFAISALVISLNASAGPLANTASVYLSADPGSWVGGAVGAPQVTWVHGIDGVFSGSTNGNHIQINYNAGYWFNFNFAAPTYDPGTNTLSGQPIHTGMYHGATRYPFNSPTKPGLSVFGNGRGNNTSNGWFDILSFGYDAATGDINTLAVDFKQFDETTTESGPGLYGSLRFNSSIAVNPVPEPETYAMLLAGLGLISAAVKRRESKQA